MIRILVEGEGEVCSLTPLFEKAGIDVEFKCIDMEGKSNIVRIGGFEKAILRQKEIGYTDFYVLIDADPCFPPYDNHYSENEGMVQRAKALAETSGLKIKVFWAKREYESWIVGGLKKRDQYCGLSKPIKDEVSGDTQSYPIDPKEWIRELVVDKRYNPRVQQCFTKHINLGLAKKRNASLRKFLNSF